MTPSRPGDTNDQASNAPRCGIFRLAGKDLPALRQAADELGLAFFHVDLCNARNVPSFIKALKRDLEFPEWFGGNLDAVNDCLTDFSWHPAPGYVITLSDFASLSANQTSFATLNAVLASAVEAWQERRIPFQIFYLQDAPASVDLPLAPAKPGEK